jgi:hypothetical protein
VRRRAKKLGPCARAGGFLNGESQDHPGKYQHHRTAAEQGDPGMERFQPAFPFHAAQLLGLHAREYQRVVTIIGIGRDREILAV